MLRRLMFAICALLILAPPGLCADRQPVSFDLPGGTLTLAPASPLFEIYTTTDDRAPNTRRLTDADFRKLDESDNAGIRTLTFSRPPDEWGRDIGVTITYQLTDKEVLTSLAIDSDSYFPVRLVRYPVVDSPQVSRFDTMLLSSNAGDAMRDPLVMIANRLGGRFSWRYPGECAMQYMVFYNQARSYYVTAYSDGDEFFDQMVRSKGDILRMSLDWFPFLADGGKWQTPQCSISVLPGDWHSAADLYREHMAPRFRAPDLPQWMKNDFHGWVQYGMKGGEDTGNKFSQLPYIYKQYVQDIGLNTLHIFSWCVDGLDHHFPDRHASPYLGTPDELTAAIDRIRAMGGHVDLYTNGRSVDIDSDFYRSGGDRALVRTEDGGLVFDGVPNYMPKACPYSKLYQDAMLDAFRLIVEKYHASGAQIDQVSCSPPIFCFDQSHGHRSPSSNWNTGVDTMLRRIHDYAKGNDPDFFIWVEGTNERFGQFYEVNQSHSESHNWTAGESLPEQFRYTYPDFLCTGLCDTIDELVQTFGQGKAFDLRTNRIFQPEIGTLIRELVRVRKDESDYFLRGRFMDDVGLDVYGDDIKCWRLDKRDGRGMLVNLWGRGRTAIDDCEAWLRVPEGLPRTRGVYPSNVRAKSKDGGIWLRITWTGPVATVVFEPEAA